MKALSIHPVPAILIFCGKKTIEVRTWKTNYRGDIVICSTNHKIKDTIPGHALCVVTLKDVIPFEKKHCAAAEMFEEDFKPGRYAWILDNLRIIKPVPIKGKLSLWDYPYDIEILEEPKTEEEDLQQYKQYYESIFI